MAKILIGNVKGPQGNTGATGATGPQGDAATIEVGSVTTVPYGQTASVTNSGTESEAVFDFVIPQGRPGEQTTDMQNLTLSSMTTPSTEFPIPAIGETGKVLWGKVVKWFSDMSALVATKLNIANVVNNLTTTASGYALDARQGKTLNDRLSSQMAAASSVVNGTSSVNFVFKILDGTTALTRIPFLLIASESGSPRYVGVGSLPALSGTLQACSMLWVAGSGDTALNIRANYNNNDTTQLRFNIANNTGNGFGIAVFVPIGCYLMSVY